MKKSRFFWVPPHITNIISWLFR